MTPISDYNRRANRLFSHIIKANRTPSSENLSIIIVTHVLPDRPALIASLDDAFNLIGVIPKTKSIHYQTLAYIRDSLKVQLLSYNRTDLQSPSIIEQICKLVPVENRLVVLDIGGYFSPHTKALKSIMGERFAGVVEDTENGHKKYAASELHCPVVSAARSPLKEPEDFLVGRSIVFSTEAVIRQNNDLLINKSVLVLGYGKIGKSIADALSVLNIAVSVFDTDPIKMAQARSHGYVVGERDVMLRQNNVLFCATGNRCFSIDDFEKVRDGTFIVSVTSSDDEFGALQGSGYHRYPTNENVTIIQPQGRKRRIFLVNEGNAVNFLHNAVVGPYIYLVQSELILGIFKLLQQTSVGIYELTREERLVLAKEWLKGFN